MTAGRGRGRDPIPTIVVDRRAVELQRLVGILREAGDFEVIQAVTTIRRAVEEVDRAAGRPPQLVVIKIEPDEPVGWIELINQVAHRPGAPAVVMTAVPNNSTEQAQQALDAGASAVIELPKKPGDRDFLASRRRFLGGLRGAVVAREDLATARADPPPSAETVAPAGPPERSPSPAPQAGVRVIAIAASTGGPLALRLVLSQLPQEHPPVLIVQHMGEAFSESLAGWLSSTIGGRSIRLARAGERLRNSEILLAPPARHLAIMRGGRVALLDQPPVAGHRPSATVLFESVAEIYGRRTIGVVLTGMGRDGAQGLLRLANLGAHTIVQDAETSVVHGMPGAAHALGAASEILPLDRIGPAISARLARDYPLRAQQSGARRRVRQ